MPKETVVLVHGLWMNSLSQFFIGKQLKKAGFNTAYFSYPTVFGSLEHNSEKLHKYLEKLASEQKTIHLTAHSLGGFVVLAALKKGQLANIGRVVLYGSPVNGSIVCQKFKYYRIARWCFGKSLKPLCDGISPPENCDIAAIAGNGGWGIGHLIAPVLVPHDGAVGVEEVRLKNSHPMRVINVSHFSMLMSKKLSDAIVQYLRHGRF